MRIAIIALAVFNAAAQTFPIAGVVIDAGSGKPMNRVRVIMAPSAHPADQNAVLTGADGRFSFQVPKGKFSLMAEYRGIRQPFGQSVPGSGFGVAIITAPDQDTSHLVYRWFPTGAISGKVLDDHADPVENALVQLIRAAVVTGVKRRRMVAWARTNDLGEYRFGQLTGGEYFVIATGEPWYANHLQILSRVSGAADNATNELARSYAPSYYPGASEASGAKPIQLAPGAEVAADFTLAPARGATIHVHCPHSPGERVLVNLLTSGAAGFDANQQQIWMMGDDQTIPGVPPGHYVVSAAGGKGTISSARQAIEVGGADVTVDLALVPAPTVTGKVIYKDAARRPHRPIYVRLVDESNGTALMRQVDQAGVFQFDNVPVGRRRVQITGADGFFAAQVTAEGATIAGRVVDVSTGAAIRLTITASDEAGTVKGFVMNGDHPVSGALAVLALVNSPNDPDEYHGFETDSDGSFDYLNIRAGEYVLFAVDRIDLEYTNPDAIRPYLESAKRIRVEPHATVNEKVSLSPVPPL